MSGERLARTAEELMRSRYTAFVVGDVDHLVRSWHPRTRPERLDLDGRQWRGLTVLRSAGGGPADDAGVVEFVAHWSHDGSTGSQHEVSRFARRAGRWLYVDGDKA